MKPDFDKIVQVETAEKAMQLCKASIMGDKKMFEKIKEAETSRECA